MKKSLFTAALTALLIVGLFATAAFAATWTANPGAEVAEDGTVTLNSLAGPTSLETAHLGVDIQPGDEISFDYAGLCTAGAPRMFVNVDGTYSNTWDDNAAGDCGQLAANPASGTVSYIYDGPAGTITNAGLVNDGTPSIVTISNVTIDGVEVIFTADQCKDGGWVGSAFRNQGLCVASFN